MIKGLIIDTDYDNAENTKLILEDCLSDLKMDIYEPGGGGIKLFRINNYDFIITAEAPVKKHLVEKKVIPFVKNVIVRKSDYITIRKSREVMFIDRSAIVGIEVIGKICYVYMLDNSYVNTRITLGALVELLEDPLLIRCHRSFALNLRFINGITRESRNRSKPDFIIDTDFDCVISDMYLEKIIETYETYKCRFVSKHIEL